MSLLAFVFAMLTAMIDRSPVPAAPPVPLSTQVGTDPMERLLRANGMSDEGLERLRALRGEPPASLLPSCEVERIAARRPLDVDALARAMATRDAAMVRDVVLRRERFVAELRRLSPGDAAVLLQVVGTSGRRAGRPDGPPDAHLPSKPAGHGPPPDRGGVCSG